MKENKYLTQQQLAERWHVSPGTIINWREAGHLPFFRLPGSSKLLYPTEQIHKIEQQHTTPVKEGNKTRKPTESQREKPVISAKSKKWRI